MDDIRKKLSRLRRMLVVFKVTAQRGYALLNVPFLALMGAGVLYPYAVGMFPWMKLWHLAIAAFIGMMTAGYLDRKLRLLHTEQDYLTESNPTLMRGLKLERN